MSSRSSRHGPLNKPTILMVDDDPADHELARRTLANSPLGTELHFASNGDEALAFLRREGAAGRLSQRTNAPRADLVLLDLNMPGRSGLDVLRTVRADPQLATTVVVILSTSNREQDVRASYDAGANSFITKPTDAAAVERMLQAVEQFWFGAVTLPVDGR